MILLLMMASIGSILAQDLPQGMTKRLPRSYEGAPPLIPHEVEPRKGLCLDCHGTGEGGAPITPHPGRADLCLLCHVGQNLKVTPFSGSPPSDNPQGTLPRRGMERGREGGM